MIKITVIAPYEEFGELFRQTFQKHDEKVHKQNEEQSEYEIEVIVEYNHENTPGCYYALNSISETRLYPCPAWHGHWHRIC